MSDHERGCQGREYTCTCGYDADLNALIETLKTALAPFAADTMPCLRKTERAYNKHGLRCLMSPMEIARLDASKALAAAKEITQ